MKKVAIRVIEASQLQIGDTIMVDDNGLAVIADIESRVPIMGSISRITYTIRDNKDMPRLVCINVTDGFRFQQYIEEQEQEQPISKEELEVKIEHMISSHYYALNAYYLRDKDEVVKDSTRHLARRIIEEVRKC